MTTSIRDLKMPLVYENEGHRRRMIRMYPQFQFKMNEWRADPTCRHCKKEMHIESRPTSWKDQVTLDHRLARCLGGIDEESNWWILCGKCNCNKSKIESKLFEYFKKEK